MTALREEALQIVKEVPDDFLVALIENLLKFKNEVVEKPKHNFTKEELQEIINSPDDPKKAAAWAAIEEWQKRNKDILNSGIDWDKELMEAIDEKYGFVG